MKPIKIKVNNQEIECPVIEGTENEHGINITQLRKKTGYITLDPGYANTGACISKITFIDGEKGILRYRGYPIEELAGKISFTETAYLLLNGELPSQDEKNQFSKSLRKNANIHEDMKRFFDGFPLNAHPMATLSSMVTALSAFHPDSESEDEEIINKNIINILAKVKTIAAYSYRKYNGLPFIYPNQDLNYVENFLHMMFSDSQEEYHADPVLVDALNLLLILHADHEQNCSTSTVRLAGSSKSNVFGAISSGISALWGPLHGGANQAVIEMLKTIKKDGNNYKKYIEYAKDKNSPFRLMGFGHRVYKNYDPRAKIIKKAADQVLTKLKINDPLLDLAKQLEEVALNDDYFVQRGLYPNVDFYSGIIYRAMGIPTNMFTVMFALGRLPGWLAHWKEMINSPDFKINRPRQIYTGPTKRSLK
ncbi:MAG: citrate (Si)-synthase [Candidatus Marinimicrobia bacterium]|nr:citrate (Si)-synthase [Candidatus Neomarinimicrobiota bacterium]|tara:strand:- start:86897 stop:88162 length:1266 start_codon:yes stop_codon:yes gene_type:complete